MPRNLFLVVTLSFLSASTLFLPTSVRAETPLKFADIQALLRQVRLLPKNQPARPARVNERLLTGDALSTARSSKADLRFNDGSFARVGELALFRFIPNTRQFSLSNGTALLLIPPGRGTTTVKTPNVSAGIRGSALFVRVAEQTGTTIVGALTSSGITVTDNLTNRLVELKAGQMAVADPRGLRLFDFDLTTFYQTSNIVRGLNLEQRPSAASLDQDIAAVQGETSEAIGKQEKIPDEAIAKNLDFIKLSPQPSGFPEDRSATLLPVELPSVGKPEIFDRGTVGVRQQKPSNLETSEVGQSSLPNISSTPSAKPPQTPTVSTPSEPEVKLTPPTTSTPPGSGVGLTPIQRDPAAVQGPEELTVPPATQPPVTPAPVNPPIQVTPAPVNPPVQVTPAPVIVPVNPPVRVTPTPVVTPLNPPVQVAPVPVIAPVNPPVQVTPAPVIVPVNPPVRVTPTPVVTPLNPPVQVVPVPVIAPVIVPIQVAPAPGTPNIQVIPAPVVAPVTPQLLEVAPKAPLVIQSVPSPTPNAVPTVPTNNPASSVVSPTPTLAPSLSPTIAPVLPLDGKSTPVQTPTLPSGT